MPSAAKRLLCRGVPRALLLAACLLGGTGVHAASPVVYAIAVGNDAVFVGGDFETGSGHSNLVSFNRQTGAVRNWRIDTDGPVYALALSPNGNSLYIGGGFTGAGGLVRFGLAAAATSVGTATPTAWNPGANAPVLALASSADGRTVYAGGDFCEIGGAPLCGIASLSTAIPAGASEASGTGGALPWVPSVDLPVYAIVLDEAAGRVYLGGDFTAVGGQARPGLAAVAVASGATLAWNPGLETGARVRALVRDQDVLYAGGAFTAGALANLAAFDPALNGPTDWNAGVNGPVQTLATVPGGSRLYVGGLFDQAGGGPRSRIAGFRIDGGEGELTDWDPGGDSAIVSIAALAVDAEREELWVGGEFTRIDGLNTSAQVTFDIAAPETALDPPGGSYQAPGMVSLDCEAGSAPCLRICYRLDGTDPQAPGDCTVLGGGGGTSIQVPVADTALRFFSEDVFGQREPVRSATYAVDALPPRTAISLPEGLYGIEGIEDVVLECDDDRLAEFGCTTYYTLDGSEPDTDSRVYDGPISLAGLFPDPSIPAAEVDPLLHLSGTVTLRVFSVDGAGNAEAAQARVYDVDLAPPVVTPSRPSGNYVAPLAVELRCDDGAGSGCAGVFYTLDGTPPALDDGGEPVAPAARYEGPLILAGATTLTVLAMDNAGNRSGGVAAAYAFTEPSGESGRLGVGAIDLAWLLLGTIWLAVSRGKGKEERGK